MSAELKHRVDFNLIRYANCWEDADILLEAFKPLGEGKSFLSIASAGDNSFSLLCLNPKKVVAVDVNKIQLYLVELKKQSIKHFDRKTTLEFLGFLPCKNRTALYHEIKPYLTKLTADFWDNHLQFIEKGVIYTGKFERYFTLFSKRILPLIHTKKRIHRLFEPKSEIEQFNFYDKRWNNWRWKILFKLFFSKRVMGKYGRDPEFLKEVNVSVSNYIYKKAERHLKSTDAQHNHILFFNLNGHFGHNLPHYLKEENYECIQQRIDQLEIMEGYAQEAIQKHGKFDGMNLSNIFEYMDKDGFSNVANDLVNGCNTNARLCYWNLMVPRRISGILPNHSVYQKDESLNLSAKDKGFFYNQFIIDKVV